MKGIGICIVTAALLTVVPLTASAHILVMVNYESKTEEGLAAHGIKDHGDRKEGIAIIDFDPETKTFGGALGPRLGTRNRKILMSPKPTISTAPAAAYHWKSTSARNRSGCM